MADIESEPPQSNGHTLSDDEDERGKMRPADIDAVSYLKISTVVLYIKFCIFNCYCNIGC